MSNIFEDLNPDEDEDFSRLLESSLNKRDNYETGEKVSGTILDIRGDTAFVDISAKSEAVIDAAELQNSSGEFEFSRGSTIEAYVISVRGGEIVLSRKIGRSGASADILETAFSSGIPVEGRVISSRKGGYSVETGGISCFCPFSQIDIRAGEEADYLNKNFHFLITEFSNNGRNVVLSRRVLLEKEALEREAQLRETLEIGSIVEGTVSSIRPFGIFVDLAGIEGLVPKSELSRSRLVSTDDFKPGQKVKASLISVDWNTKKISLSIKNTEPDPWESSENLKSGTVHNGIVTNLISSGAFVQIIPGLEGFVHISRMSFTKRVNRPEDVLKPGDSVSVRVMDVDRKAQKISLELMTDEADPWLISESELTGRVLSATVEGSRSSGLNVRLDSGLSGFVPSSELTDRKSFDIQKDYPTGSSLEVMLIRYEPDRKNAVFSAIAVKNGKEQEAYETFKESNNGSAGINLGNLLGDKFKDIKKTIGE